MKILEPKATGEILESTAMHTLIAMETTGQVIKL
jgi:hypothetical protein